MSVISKSSQQRGHISSSLSLIPEIDWPRRALTQPGEAKENKRKHRSGDGVAGESGVSTTHVIKLAHNVGPGGALGTAKRCLGSRRRAKALSGTSQEVSSLQAASNLPQTSWNFQCPGHAAGQGVTSSPRDTVAVSSLPRARFLSNILFGGSMALRTDIGWRWPEKKARRRDRIWHDIDPRRQEERIRTTEIPTPSPSRRSPRLRESQFTPTRCFPGKLAF